MDFLDPKKQRAYNIRLFIGFILIGITLLLATTILALITAGYTINRKTGQVTQNSLLFINSQPVSANIYINGVSSGTTNARLNLNAGNYSLSLSHNGYRSWSNSVTLYGGQVEQLNYPFLFPTSPTKTNVLNLTSEPSVASFTPDRHWLLVSVPGQLGSFYMIDMTNLKTPITTVTIPPSVLAAGPGTNMLSAVEWSTDNQHLVLEDSYQGGSQFIMLDRLNPANSINLTKLFSTTSFSYIKLDNEAYNKIYLLDQSTGDLSLGDVIAKTVTPILSNVQSFWPYGTNQILYITADTKNPSEVDADIWDSSYNRSFNLRDLPVGTSYELNMASYSGNLYAVIGSSSSNYAYIYQNPLSQLTATPNQPPLPYTLMIITGSPEDVTFSDSARFIALQSGSQFAVYDIQYDQHYHYNTNLAFQPNQLATWMDGNRLSAIINSKLTIWDFDGTNTVSYTDASSDFPPIFNRNYNGAYSLIAAPKTTTGAWEVMRTSLIAGKP